MTLNRDTIEEAISERRADRGISQPAMTQQLKRRGLKASQSRISDIERGYALFMKYWVTPQERFDVLQEYGFSVDEIRVLNRKHLLGLDQILLPEGTHSVGISEAGRVDHVGIVSAGNGGSGVLVAKKKISVPDWIASQFDLDYVFAADIDGSSMTCEDVARTIPQGATAFFHRPSPKMQPRASDIVYAYVPVRDQSVIKLYKPAKGFALLTSYNEESEPIVVNESNPATVQGIYLGLETRASRFR